jgi:predicted dehydrogenase
MSMNPPHQTLDRRTFLQTATAGLGAFAIAPLLDPVLAAPFSSAMNVAVVGIGRQGRAIMAELQKFGADVTISAICDSDDSRLQAGLRRAPEAAGFADHRALLDARKDVQAIVISTPTHQHKQIAIDALAAGKHVYCECPLAHTIEDCQEIVRAARSATTIFQTGAQGRANPVYKLARTFAKSGSIRDYIALRAQNFQKNSWRTPANDPARERALNWRLDPEVSIGLLGENGAQQFDVFHFYLDKYPVKVRAGGSIKGWDDGRQTYDTAWCDLVFDDGVTLQYQTSLANSYEDVFEQFHGTMGTIKLTWSHGWLFKEADAPTQGWEVYANRQQFHNEEGITLIADATKLAAQGKLKEGVGLPNDPLYYALESFLRSVDEGAPPVCSADEGMRATAIAILAHQAAVKGEEIAIDGAMLNV